MNYKGMVSAAWLMLASLCMQAQETFVIEGNVKNVKQGVCINLFRMEGDVGSSVARDTLRGESFRFEVPVSGDGTDRMTLMIRDGNLYTMGLSLWAKGGSHIRLTGEDMNVYTWQVESDMPQQQTWQLFVDDSRELWNRKQENRMELMQFRRKYPRKPEDEALLKKLVAQRDSLERIGKELDRRIDANVIARMKQLPVEEVWMDKLHGLALSVKYDSLFSYRKEVEELYARLSDEQRQTSVGQDICSYLAPPETVSSGEKAADGDLFDLEGNVHHLSDFQGKAVLIDFWSRGCGPCLMAMPELGEISEKYKDRLVVVSLSIDDKTNWEVASRQHKITWWNLNDLKGNHGIYAKYDAGSIPRYVFLSPQGEVVEMWSGYGKGSLLKKMEQLLNNP